jgi:hypothetical protein
MRSEEARVTDVVGVVREFEPSRRASEEIRACYEAAVPITRKAVNADDRQATDNSQTWRELEGA